MAHFNCAGPSSPLTTTRPGSSLFREAIDELLQSYPKKSKQPRFVTRHLSSSLSVTAEDVQQSIAQMEQDSSNKTSTRIIRKILEPVISVMVDYSGIVDTLAQADPMPTAVIWGCLKAVVECSKRYIGLYTSIRSQLSALTERLSRLTDYEELFGHSTAMQEVLKASYVNILRFWSKVEEECDRCAALAVLRAATSFGTKRLDEILVDLTCDADNIAKLVPIIQERLNRGEREDAAEERRKAGVVRDELLAWIKEQREDKLQRDIDRKRARQKDVREWLRGASSLNESNSRHYARGLSVLEPRTCGWLLEDDSFKEWLDKESSSTTLWLNASPGTGKSVLCAYAIEQIKKTAPSSGVAFQYYSFDEQYSSLQTYRNIADQLFSQLYSHLQDVPDDIHAHVQNSNSDLENVKKLIRFLVAEMSPTYIFLDGLDEECNEEMKWSDASKVMDFFEDLAHENPPLVRLWCSSQDRPCVRAKVKEFSTIYVGEHKNSADIEVYLASALPMLDSLDVDAGTKNLVLEDLRRQAQGNFLWASLMVKTVSQATSLTDIQEQIQNGLPEHYEKYYDRKMNSLEVSQRSLVSKILSCIVYAKRPLRLEELCEAMGLCATEYGENMSSRKALFKSRVLGLCAPLVEIREVGQDKPENVCTLSHASVRNYLIRNPRILQDEKKNSRGPGSCLISNAEIASICLKYLLQPRYQRLLTKQDDTFLTAAGEDILDHHLLIYAAKYWDKHLDDVEYTDEWCKNVEDFVRSRQFITCMQIQSLLVEGQFSSWINIAIAWAGPGFRRVFPRWFTKRNRCGELLSQQYYAFAGEWGYFLNEIVSGRGLFPGEVDRCLWSTLGPQNFLHKSKSRFKNFIFMDQVEPNDHGSNVYFEQIDSQGNEVQVMKLQRLEGDSSRLQVQCQKWCLNGHRPKVKYTLTIHASREGWPLYENPLRNTMVGRPLPISCTSDFRFLRVGSQLFYESEAGKYSYLPRSEDESSYFEDLASNGRYFAMATRQRLYDRDLESTGLDDNTVEGFGKLFSDALEELAASLQEQSSASSNTLNNSETISSGKSMSNGSQSSINSSMTSLSIEETAKDCLPGEIDSESLKLETDTELSSVESNSARTSWSEGSTKARSDETDDEDQWNDWGSTEDEMELKELSDMSEDSSESSSEELVIEEEPDLVNSTDENQAQSKSELQSFIDSGRSSNSEDEQTDDDDDDPLESNYSQSADSEDDSDDEDQGGARLEDLMSERRKASRGSAGCPRTKLQVYDTTTGKALPVFRFESSFSSPLFSSPPIFHPSASLIVWPLGRCEILFANFTMNTYFTRTLRCSAPRSCHIFVKGQFSTCGQYLHLAALEARKDEAPIEGGPEPPLQLTLQVSTHRLSSTKTARSPPRLIFRTHITLGSTNSLSISHLPFTLTWTARELYLTKSSRVLDVIRIPLFRAAPSETEASHAYVCCQRVFLPQSAEIRNVHYFPPNKDAKGDKADQATVIVGSRISVPNRGGIVLKKSKESSPPVGFYIQEKDQLGGWQKMGGPRVEEMQKINVMGGRLQGKFETFDRNEDCDIIPYLN